MSFDTRSFVKVDSDDVAALALSRLKALAEWRQREWAKLIKTYRASRQWWKRYMPWLKDLSEDEIRRRITLDADWRWLNPDLLAVGSERRCQKLLNAASAAPTMFVHVEDYHDLIA